MSDDPLKQQFEKNKIEFVLIEIDAGHIFAGLAHDADAPEKAKRNLVNARKAYDTVCDFLLKNDIPNQAVRRQIARGVDNLKQVLLAMGEKFDD